MTAKEFTLSIVFIALIIELMMLILSKIGGWITDVGGDLAVVGVIIFVPALATLLFLSYLRVPAGEFGALATLTTPLTILLQVMTARVLSPGYYDESSGGVVVTLLFYIGFLLGIAFYKAFQPFKASR
ncbi:hypothetical protein [Thermococcus sp.]|uniref:hypothetical protein n=1 Tax=Thermococcus sp. TaxID=35749 RepID=UPI0025DB330B|nr:hypothetical protein [Thermococcus sp.]